MKHVGLRDLSLSLSRQTLFTEGTAWQIQTMVPFQFAQSAIALLVKLMLSFPF